MYGIEMQIVDAIQSLGDGFYYLMKGLSKIGASNVYFMVIVILMWCYDYKKAGIAALMVSLSGLLAESIKVVIGMPRPFHIRANRTIIESFGMPSGHALSAVTFWGWLMQVFKKRYVKIIGVIMILGIALSRIYNDSHFLSQVLVGLVLGLFILLVYVFKYDALYKGFKKCSVFKKHLLMIVLPVVLVPMATVGFYANGGVNGFENLLETIRLGGLFYGFVLGLNYAGAMEKSFVSGSTFLKTGVKIAVALLVLMVYGMLIAVFENIVSINGPMGVSCILLWNIFYGLFITYFVPMLFVKMKLMKVE